MRMVILAVVAVLVLGGGAGAYFYFSKPAEAATTDEHGQAQKAHEEEEVAVEEHVEFVELDPLILPIIDADGISQVVSMVIALEVSNPEAKAKIEKLTPRLKDAYIQDMYGVLNDQAAMEGGVVQVGYIKKRLSAITIKILGEEAVNDVLLQVVQQRPV